MFNGNTMSLVTDLGILGPQINNKDYLSIAAITTSQYPNLSNIYNAGILVPPTSILMAWAEGDNLALWNEYPQYLMTKDPDDMIVALLAAMTKKNIILYIPADDFKVFGQLLLSHILFVYGITVNYPPSVFSIDTTKVPMIVSKFYMIDVMEPQDYLAAYPAQFELPDFVINKLACDLNPFGGTPATFMQYRDYFNNMNRSKAQQREPRTMVSIANKGGAVQ